MHLAIRRFATIGILATLLAATAAYAQDTEEGNEKVGRTRNELRALLKQYPPRLADVLKLDPTLLGNDAYLAPYPNIKTFLQQHPEIARDPDYFFGSVSSQLDDLKRAVQEAELASRYDRRSISRDFFNALGPLLIFFVVVGVLMWAVRNLQDHRRWMRVWRAQSEAHSKLMDRLTTNEDMLAYLQTPAGKRFFESSVMPVDPSPPRPSLLPVGRITWSIQAGLLLLLGGISLRFATVQSGLTQDDAITLNLFSVVAIGLGVSFILGAAASFMISAKLGLIEQPSEARRPPTVAGPPSST